MRRLLTLLVLMLTPSLCFAQANAHMLSGVNAQVGTSYTFQAADQIKLTTFNNPNPVAVTLPSPSTPNFGPGTLFSVRNLGVGTVTITPLGSTIDGQSTLVLTQGQGADIYSDGVNYESQKGAGTASLTGMTASQVPIAATGTTITSSKPIQGSADTSIFGAGTVSGINAPLCTDANGGATTVGCPSGGGSPAGSDFQAQVHNGAAFGSTPCFSVTAPASSSALGVGGCDYSFIGPNPNGADIRNYGAASFNQFSPPASAGITGSCNGTTTVTLSAASLFVNRVGIDLLGCGPTNALSTPGAPTVTTNLAQAGTATGNVVAGLTGGTTYNYKIAAQDLGMGVTAASIAGTVTTGPTSLGVQTTTINTCSLSTNIVTCSTTAAHGLAVGAEIKIRSGPVGINGNWQVATVPDTTHFTFISTQDTRNGAIVSTTGGTVTYWNCNHVTWTAVTNAYRYLIYSDRGSPGTFNLIGISKPAYPNASDSTDGSLYFDDFGSSSSYGTPPWTVPTTAPSAATNDTLVTTIVSGAGTTTLVVANAASQTLAGTPVRVDNAPNIKAAANAFNGSVWVPQGVFANYITNSILDLTTANSNHGVSINVSTQNTWGDTLILGFQSEIVGKPIKIPGGGGSFAGGSYPEQFLLGAPGIHFAGSAGNGGLGGISYLQLDGQSNGQTVLVVDGAGGENQGWELNNLDVGCGNTSGVDDTCMPIMVRGGPGQSGQFTSKGRLTVAGAQVASSNTPSLYNACAAQNKLDEAFFSGRGPMFQACSAVQTTTTIEWYYCQGCQTPLISLAGPKTGGGSQLSYLIVNQLTNDTSVSPILSSYSVTGTINPVVWYGFSGGIATINSPSYTGATALYLTGPAGLGGQNTASETVISASPGSGGAIDGIFNTTAPGVYTSKQFNAALTTGIGYPMFISLTPMAAPALALAAGGSVPVGAHTYQILPIWPGGSAGPPSQLATITTTTGNQTVNITWTPLGVTTGCTGYVILRDQLTLNNPTLPILGCGSSSSTDTSASTFGSAAITMTAGGPTMMRPGLGGIVTPALQFGGQAIVAPTNAGMMLVTSEVPTFFDNFQRVSINTGGPCPGGSCYSTSTAGTGAISIVSNNLTGTLAATGDSVTAQWNAVPAFGDSQFEEFVVTGDVTSGQSLYRSILNLAGGSFYDFRMYNQASTGFQILKNGATSLGTATGTVAVGDRFRVERLPAVSGTITLRIIRCPSGSSCSVVLSVTDSTSILTGGTMQLIMLSFSGAHTLSVTDLSGGNLGPSLAAMDMESDFQQPIHTQTLTVGNTAPLGATALGIGIYSTAWTPSSAICTDSTSRLTTTACAGGSLSGMTAGQLAVAGSASTITSSKAIQGTDTNILSSSTVAAGTGNPFCTDTGSGATTTGCPNLSGLTTGQVPIAGSAITVTSSKALQGTDASVLSSGTVSGTGATLCTDANGGATTVGCTGGSISGLTAGGVAIAGTATTITSSKPQQGTDANILTSGTISANTPALLCTDANSGATTSNCSVYNTQSAATNANIAATNMVASAPANTMYMYMWTISLTTVGTGCTSTTSVVLNLIFTDPSAAGSVTESLGQISIAPGGNGTLGFVAQGNDTVYAKSATAVQYSTSGYTPGTGCTVNPSYQVTMRLIPIS